MQWQQQVRRHFGISAMSRADAGVWQWCVQFACTESGAVRGPEEPAPHQHVSCHTAQPGLDGAICVAFSLLYMCAHRRSLHSLNATPVSTHTPVCSALDTVWLLLWFLQTPVQHTHTRRCVPSFHCQATCCMWCGPVTCNGPGAEPWGPAAAAGAAACPCPGAGVCQPWGAAVQGLRVGGAGGWGCHWVCGLGVCCLLGCCDDIRIAYKLQRCVDTGHAHGVRQGMFLLRCCC